MMSGDIVRIDTDVGRRPLHGVAATRAIEARRLAGTAPFALMQAAGAAVARLAIGLAPHARHAVVFAGPGNNGGDGLVAATFLHRLGRRVDVFLFADPERLPPDAGEALAQARAAGVSIRDGSPPDMGATTAPDLIIDALLGIGGSRAPDGALADAIDLMQARAVRSARVLAVDVPSGLDADRGRPFGAACVRATDTLALLTIKPGLVTGHGGDFAGKLWHAGLEARRDGSALLSIPNVPSRPADKAEAVEPCAWLVGGGDETLAPTVRRPSQNKGSFGDVAVVGGAAGMRGAAWLAARAAQAAGCGRVFVDLLDSDPSSDGTDMLRPELMLRKDWAAGDVGSLARTVVVCGCGAADAMRASLPRLLSACHRLVVDADALNAIARDDSLGLLLMARRRRGWPTILTPHPLEAARLAGTDADSVQADRLGQACALAERYGCIVVLKGAGSVIAAAGERPRINATGHVGLASAGTGDVLAGWIGGRWAASGSDAADGAVAAMNVAFDVATRGVIEHGLAAGAEGPGAVRAGDLVENLHRFARRRAPHAG